ncbi:isoprenyl transferase [Weeksellaceae bacterium KMM 9713]|uniref:Isoprenyl transferase n=1 Tax=Profundicola chukchiensis TaxID=2961959 RepID=A0A9X4RU05_9FLAO|nr:isoprenyl transferase [Profundicola chukchiensis]MDG4945628.1 isoprenyl transferase [Profundicola chukchiensis]MDG4949433.1 isoprenyl transferase [Profundicola chukchiensis]
MQQTLRNKIDSSNIPQHVAIIMDGNGRWAKKKGMLRTFGHKNAIKAVRSAIEGCDDLGIPYLTLYAFSSENWSRPMEEVGFLMGLLASSLKKELKTLQENNIRLCTIGDIDKLPKDVSAELKSVMESTKNNTKAVLTLALSYGAKDEIISAVKSIAKDVKEDNLEINNITPEVFKNYLFTADLPDVDLMIRTSGETRISNFLLWQIAYAELYFTDILWPDFRKKDLFEAIYSYQKRERRFGKTGDQLTEPKN